MRDRIHRYTSPPVFSDDPAKTRQARMLNDILLVNMLAVLVALVVSLVTSTPKYVSLVICLFIIILTALRLWMDHGAVKQASFALVLFFLCGVTIISALLGTSNSAVNGYYILAIVIAGLLLDSRAMSGVGILCAIAITALEYAGNRGWLSPASSNDAVLEWLTMLIIFVNTGLFIHLIRLRYLEELRQRHQAEQNARKSEARSSASFISQPSARRRRWLCWIGCAWRSPAS